MLFKNITIIDENIDIKENQYVCITDDKITYIGDSQPEYSGEVYDGKGKLLMSSFTNSHSHIAMTIMRGYGENLPLDRWLNEKIFPFEDKMTKDDVKNSTMLGIAEMLRFGIVSTTDMYFFCDTIADAFIETGAKLNLSRAIVSFDDTKYKALQSYRESVELINNYHNKHEGKILIDLSIHAEYTSNPAVVAALAEHAGEERLNVHIHLSETKKEHEECIKRHKKTPTEYFNSLGLFKNKTVAAHSVWLSGDDFDILAENNVSVASCPVSNLKLASGICDIKRLTEKKINIGIGTDSVASNNNLNFIEEIKMYSMLNKLKHYDATLVTPKQAIYAATRAGAIIQGRQDCGSLKVGNKADLIVMDIDKPNMKPVHNLLNNLVYSSSGSDIILTMSDGKILFKDGEYKTIDMEKISYCRKI